MDLSWQESHINKLSVEPLSHSTNNFEETPSK